MDETEKLIADGKRLALFLADEAVKAALERLAEQYVREWKKAPDIEAREAAWAKAQALDDVRRELQIVVDRGGRANADLQRQKRSR